MAQCPLHHRLREVKAPAAVAGDGGAQCLEAAVVVEGHVPFREVRVALAGKGDVLIAGQPQPNGPSGQRRPQRGNRGETVRLHFLTAEAPAHAQALHRNVMVVQSQHVGDDFLGLGGVLRAALNEHLPTLVHVRQRRVGLQVEVFLPAELELPTETVGSVGQADFDVAAAHRGLAALETVCGNGFPDGDQGRQGFVLDLNGFRAEARCFQTFAKHPAHRVAVEHDLAGEEGFVVLDAGVVDARHVLSRQHPDHPGHLKGGGDVQGRHAGVGVRGLQRPGMEHVLVADDEVVGVERGARGVIGCVFVSDRNADHRVLGAFCEGFHRETS